MRLPFYKQSTDFYCGPASLQMLFEYNRLKLDQDELANLLGTCPKQGTEHEMILNVIDEHGFSFFANNQSSVEEIQHFLDQKLPVLVNYLEPKDNEGHYAVAVGHDEQKIILNDPTHGAGFALPIADFEQRFRCSQNKDSNIVVITGRTEE